MKNYKIFQFDRNRHKEGVACYIRKDLSYTIILAFPREIKCVFFEIVLTNSKPVAVGTIYRPPHQSFILEILNENMNEIDSASNKIYIFGDFNINLSLNDSYFLSRKKKMC